MHPIFLFFCVLQLLLTSLRASLPADISFLIADLKYSEVEGVKICEIQQGSLSAFSGYDYLTGSKSYVENYVTNYLMRLGKPIFFRQRDVTNPVLARILKEEGAYSFINLGQITNNALFKEVSTLSVQDPAHIEDYHSLVIASPKVIPSLPEFRKLFPGALVLEGATYPYWIDKYKMTLLFKDDPILEAVKPSWGLFQKKYSPTLAQKIAEQLGGDRFVIKPRSSFLGKGVLLVSKNDLDQTLYTMIEQKKDLRKHKDKDLQFWGSENHDSFLVEKFCPSDPVAAPQFDHKLFDGTMRVVFFLAYSEGKIQLDIIEMHWKLPAHSISEFGTLSQMHKSIGKAPHFAFVDPEVQQKVQQKLSEALPRLYERMLGISQKVEVSP